MNYEVVMGLEVHVELSTESKLFCSCSAKFGAGPNENICPACMGMPGYPPVTNKKAVELGVRIGHALKAKINLFSRFDRKHYFYPDLPSGYQNSQMYHPIVTNGLVEVLDENGKVAKIRINRAHLEEDAGKQIHFNDYSLIDSLYTISTK